MPRNDFINVDGTINYDNIASTKDFSAKMSYFNVKDYGAKGDGFTDDTIAFQNTFNACINAGGGDIIIPHSTSFYNLTNSISVTLSEGIGIRVLGISYPEVRLTSVASGQKLEMFAFNRITNTPSYTSVKVEGIHFNGIGCPEDWNQTVYANVALVIGLHIEAAFACVKDCHFEYMYGYGIRIQYYKKAVVDDCHFENVGGHWHIDDAYDCFGDSIYFAYSQGDYALASVRNCRMIGYPSNRISLSRIATTFEFGAGVGQVENCYMEGYERSIHIENCPTIKLDINNVTMNRTTVGLFLSTGARSININSMKFIGNLGNYSGTSGPIGTNSITTSPDSVHLDDCVFSLASDCESFIDVPLYFKGCKFDGSTNRWTVKSVQIKTIDSCEFKGNAVYFYGSQMERIINCTLTGIATRTEVIKWDGANSYAIKILGCRFINAFISLSNVPDFNFEFDSCRFEKDGSITLVDDSNTAVSNFINDYGSTIIIRDCLEIVNATFPFSEYTDTHARLIGSNYKVVAGTWSSY